MFQRHNGRGGREGVPLGGGLRENMGGHSGGQGGPPRLFSSGGELLVSFHARIGIFPDPYSTWSPCKSHGSGFGFRPRGWNASYCLKYRLVVTSIVDPDPVDR
jgi:hypothetical protein